MTTNLIISRTHELAEVAPTVAPTGATCNPAVDLPPWVLDVQKGKKALPQYGPGSSQLDDAPATTPLQYEIPASYRQMSATELDERISRARQMLGKRLVILGHHYQREDIIKYADFRGDSYKLSVQAAERHEAEYIVFCGVHFMAESADVLSGPNQQVILPNMAAGCSMADMANLEDVLNCWDDLNTVLDSDDPAGRNRQPVLPVTYMNSAADLKAFCGEHNGIVCTSSNSDKILEWAFERGQRVLFFPDQHLGRNTGVKMGIPLDQMVLWNPRKPLGGNRPEQLRNARIILWSGFCSVHKRFTPAQVAKARADYPGVKVIVHPECPMEVVGLADEAGSTEYIIQAVEKAPAGSVLAIGTEINLVRRLQAENPDKTIFCLDPVICPCSTMYRIHPAYLAWVLDGLLEGKVYNHIVVESKTAEWARVALDRMIECTSAPR